MATIAAARTRPFALRRRRCKLVGIDADGQRRMPITKLATWRIMGMWDSGKWFLVVMGRTKAECKRLLSAALVDYGSLDLERIAWLWLERFKLDTDPVDEDRLILDWVPHSIISVQRLARLRVATRRRELTGSRR